MWLALCAILFFIYGIQPQSRTGWLLFIFFGPPAYAVAEILGEAFVGRVDRAPGLRFLNTRVAERTAGVRFSWERVGYLLLRTLLIIGVFLAAIAGIQYALPGPAHRFGEFLARHFAAV